MGQHKTNPTAILAKEGKLPPKKKEVRFTQRQLRALYAEHMLKRLGMKNDSLKGDYNE